MEAGRRRRGCGAVGRPPGGVEDPSEAAAEVEV